MDEIIGFELPAATAKYLGRLRRIVVWNKEHDFVIELLTNNFKLSAATIANFYKARWQIEILFRNLKQLLRINNFVGISCNTVKI